MRYIDILTEAKLFFSKADVEKAAEEDEFHHVLLTMTGNGEIHIGYLDQERRGKPADHPDVSYRRRLEIHLWFHDHKIRFRQAAAGESLKPKVQQALRSLHAADIIDSTWKIETSMGPGRYVNSKFVNEPNPIDRKSISELVDKAIRLSPVTKDLVLYHGTSSMDWEKIQKVGLHPLGFGTNNQHGSESRGKHAGNTGVLYLAGTLNKAYDYAKSREDDWNRKLHKSEYIKDELNDPIVIAVTVPDVSKLVADDDLVNGVARDVARKIFAAKSPEEKNRLAIKIGNERGFAIKDPSITQMLWRETDEGFAEIFAKLPPRIFKLWLASLKRNDQVGYRGFIPPKFLKRVM